jgi:hypothetical protein
MFYESKEDEKAEFLIRELVMIGTGVDDGAMFNPDATSGFLTTCRALRVPHKLIHSNKIDWFIAEQYSSQCNILEALEPT